MQSFISRLIEQARVPRGLTRVMAGLAFAALFSACSDSSGPDRLQTLTITPSSATLGPNGTQQFTVTGTGTDGQPLTIEGESWAIVNGGGSINSSTGLFTAGTVAGTFANTVRVTCNGITALATIIVTPGPLATITVTPNPATLAINATQQFTAVGRDAFGNVVPITPVWSVTAGGGTINATTGVFTAGTATGTFANTVRATSGTIFGSATVIVIAGPLVTITVTPNPATVPMGTTQQFTAVGRDAGGNIVPITPVWSVTNGGGTINAATGIFTAGSTSGTFDNTVRATSGTIFGTATVIVPVAPGGPGALATITVTPNPATIQVNTSQQFTAVGRDANGNIVPITPVWSVTNGGGTINPSTGLFTAGAVTGTFTNTVRATSGTIFGTATVIVTSTPPPPPPPPSPINLRTAAPFGILAGSTVTCITGGTVNAEIGISPGTALVGFGPCVVTGAKHLADAVAAQAQLDLTSAYNEAAGLPCGTVVGTANIGGTTRAAGVYCSASSILITGDLTLDGGGNPNAVFVFQAGSTLTSSGNIVLINGAQAKNVFFQVGTSATLGVGPSTFRGNILAFTSITLNDNVTLIGRALARNGAVTLGNNNTITLP